MLRYASKWVIYPIAWLILMIIPLLFFWARTNGGGISSVNNFRISSFSANYVVAPMGNGAKIEVTEEITATFPPNQNRGIERVLDNYYGDTQISRSSLRVTTPGGQPMPWTTYVGGNGTTVVRIGDPSRYVSGTVTYVISYTLTSAMLATSDGRQEIYLDTNGTGWQVPIDRVNVSLTIDPALASKLTGDMACYHGVAGSTQRCTINRQGDTFTASQSGLGRRHGVTVAVGFQANTVQQTLPPLRSGVWIPPGFATVALPALGLAVLVPTLIVRHLRRRTVHNKRPIVTQFEAPKDLEPMVAADFLCRPETGASAQLTRLVLVGMATLTTAGKASLTEATGSTVGPSDVASLRDNIYVELTPKLKSMKDRRIQKVCTILWGSSGGRLTKLNSFFADYRLRTAAESRMHALEMSYLREPGKSPVPLLVIGFIVMLIGGWIGLANGFGNVVIFLIAGLIGVLALVAAVYYWPPIGRLTGVGKQMRDYLFGLQDFVMMAEADRISWLQNAKDAPRITGPNDETLIKLYEPLLPYAIIFGAETSWRKVIGDLYEHMPALPAFALPAADLEALVSWHSEARTNDYRTWTSPDEQRNFFSSRPEFGQGPVATGIGDAFQAFDSWASSRDDDDSSGSGGWFSGGGSSSSFSSSSSSGSSGGGHSGGGVGGGGGGGW